MKRCSCCGETKPLGLFTRCSRAADGRQSWCKACKAAEARARYASAGESARERSRERMRARRAADPDRERTYIDAWRAENADRVRQRDAARRAKPERQAWQAAYWRAWRAGNIERARAIARKGQQVRRARQLATLVDVVDPQVVFERDDGVCGICQTPVDPQDWHLDHVKPLFAGGEHSYANVRVTHPKCNLSRPRLADTPVPAELGAAA